MIKYNIKSNDTFYYTSHKDLDIIINVYERNDKIYYSDNIQMKSGINYYTKVNNDWTNKKVEIIDKNKNEKILEFILQGKINDELLNHSIDYNNKTTNLYIDLLKKSLIDYIDLDNNDKHDKIEGKDLYPSKASKTMIGLRALENIEYCINEINKNEIEGDFIETGVWRGGATIFMKALSDIFNMNKKVWVADSFEGLPKSDNNIDNDFFHNESKNGLIVPLKEVKNNFKKYNLLDNNVKFLKGWFKDTLNTKDIDKLSLLRLDGDMYSSTMQSLNYLYPKLQIGGYIIIDDYYSVKECKIAIDEYRKKFNINEDMIRINWACVYWKKEK